MEKFLSIVSKEIIKETGGDFRNLTVVFPSRRSGLYFRRELVKEFEGKPVISPAIFSINDFIFKYSGLRSENVLNLIFRLYDVQRSFGMNEEPDRFYEWGRVMLSDFDEMDRSLADAEKLFGIVSDIKALESRYELETDKDYYLFWKNFNESDEESKKRFKDIWVQLPKIYKKFTEELLSDNLAYDGLAYKKLSNDLDEGKVDFSSGKIIFAGFNYLSKSEMNILYESAVQSGGKIYFDADKFYISDPMNEAGTFINKNAELLKRRLEKNKYKFEDYVKIIDGNGIDIKDKEIKIIGAPLSSGMAKALGNELDALNIENENEVAILLPDDSMLLPALSSIPDKIKNYNVTMGLPFRDTPLYSLVYLIRDLQANILNGKFYYEDVIKILLHPYVRFENMSSVHKIVNGMKTKNQVYVDRDSIFGGEKFLTIADKIFVVTDKSETIFEYIRSIVSALYERIHKDDFKAKFHIEYIFGFYTHAKVLQDCIEKYGLKVSVDVYWNVLADIVRSQNIPLTGEPVTGLQVMGLLESRAIDFNTVFILSANEAKLPQINISGSYIPYQIRRYFGMKTFDDDSKIQAYNFFRAIQRAENVYILYDSLISESSKGKSRFILQIENELAETSVKEKSYSIQMTPAKDDNISIEKTDELLSRITKLSPTDISNYINCSLMFYFKKILELEEEDTIDDEYNAALFGSLFHKVMEMLYTPYSEKEVNRKTLDDMIGNVEKNFDKIFSDAADDITREQKEKYHKEKIIDTGIFGKNKAYKEVIKELVLKILRRDAENVPFKILGLEMKLEKADYEFTGDGNTKRKIILNGKLDRVEEKDGKILIVDYKTGGKKFPRTLAISNVNQDMPKPANKDYFQAGFYMYLYKLVKNEDANAGMFYVARENDLTKVLPDETGDAVKNDFINNYKEFLNEKLHEIFNKDINFEKTADTDNCKYCAMNSLCYRDGI